MAKSYLTLKFLPSILVPWQVILVWCTSACRLLAYNDHHVDIPQPVTTMHACKCIHSHICACTNIRHTCMLQHIRCLKTLFPAKSSEVHVSWSVNLARYRVTERYALRDLLWNTHETWCRWSLAPTVWMGIREFLGLHSLKKTKSPFNAGLAFLLSRRRHQCFPKNKKDA